MARDEDDVATQQEHPMVELILALGRGWRDDPLRTVAGINAGRQWIAEWQREAVLLAREQGYTWDEVGRACGVSRQAAWERWGKA